MMNDPARKTADDDAILSTESVAAEIGISAEQLIALIEEGLASGEPVDGPTAMAKIRLELEAGRFNKASGAR